jgi:hypothetical protein
MQQRCGDGSYMVVAFFVWWHLPRFAYFQRWVTLMSSSVCW